MKLLGSTDPWSDTITVMHEVESGTLSPGSAKVLCSWYVSAPAMAEFATGKAVSAIALRYAVTKARDEFAQYPDAACASDLVNLASLLAWINGQLVMVRA